MTFIYWVNDYLTLGYIDIDILQGNNYTYWITTLNEAGESELSDSVNFFIPPAVIVGDDDDDEEEPQKKEKEFPVLPVVIVVIVILIILAVVAFLVFRKRQETQKELMLGPVQVGSVDPAVGADDTFGIFHPDQVQQSQPTIQPVGQEIVYPQQPVGSEGYDQSGQYYPDQNYQQDPYQQQGYVQGGYPNQEPVDQGQYQQMVQDVYYEERTPQYDPPPAQQGYIDPQSQYPQQQQYYPQDNAQDPNYEQQPIDPKEQPPAKEFFAPPEAVIQPETQEFSTHPPEQEQPRPTLPETEDTL